MADLPGRANTPAEKRQIIERLLAVWQKHPELRLGQLIIALGYGSARSGTSIFYVEDEEFLRRIEMESDDLTKLP